MDDYIAIALIQLAQSVGVMQGLVVFLFVLMVMFAMFAIMREQQIGRLKSFLREKKLLQLYGEWRHEKRKMRAAMIKMLFGRE